jgi:GrpB-like predicted nucleotidyltransferase (UPF0157 family)
MSLQDQRRAFKDRLKSQPVIVKQGLPGSGNKRDLTEQQKDDLEALQAKKKKALGACF